MQNKNYIFITSSAIQSSADLIYQKLQFFCRFSSSVIASGFCYFGLNGANRKSDVTDDHCFIHVTVVSYLHFSNTLECLRLSQHSTRPTYILHFILKGSLSILKFTNHLELKKISFKREPSLVLSWLVVLICFLYC